MDSLNFHLVEAAATTAIDHMRVTDEVDLEQLDRNGKYKLTVKNTKRNEERVFEIKLKFFIKD